jgi:hypothetical protein
MCGAKTVPEAVDFENGVTVCIWACKRRSNALEKIT